MNYLEIITAIERKAGRPADAVPDEAGPILAVKIGGALIGDFWLVLSEDEPFESGYGIPVYRPNEIKALMGKEYSQDELIRIHQIKNVFDGKLVQ